MDLLSSRLSSPRQANCLLRVGSPTSRNSADDGHSGSVIDHGQHLVLSSISLMTGLINLLGFIPEAGTASGKSRAATTHTTTQTAGGNTGSVGIGLHESQPVSGTSADSQSMAHRSRLNTTQSGTRASNPPFAERW